MQSLLVGPPLQPPPVATLVDALLALGDRPGPWLTVHAGPERSVLTGAEVVLLARRWARALTDAGLRPGGRVAMILPNDARFVGVFFGALLAGGVPVPLAWPFALANLERALEPLRPLVAAADPDVVVAPPALAAVGPWPAPVVSEPAGAPLETTASPGSSDLAFLQFTSGSLGRPRGAAISHGAVVASAWAMGQALRVGPDDVGVSWLPLYHDMGLVGALLCPVLYRFPIHLMAPAEFLLHPVRWLRRLSEAGGTLAPAPNFAYDLCARRVKDPTGLDLSRWRVALNGAEPVHRATLDEFVRRFGPVGFRADALRPVYGLAENTLGACFFDPTDVAMDVRVQSRDVVSVGKPLPGMEVGVRAPGGTWAEEGEPGEVVVRGPALMNGYFRDPEATAAALRDGWLHTGDLGVVRGGQLYITGREKDLVIQNGVKFHPYDIERVAAVAADAPPNGVAAFSVPGNTGTEDLVVVVEVRSAGAEGVEKRVRGSLLEALGVRADRVVAVPPGALPRTTSGKVRRPAAAAMFGAPA